MIHVKGAEKVAAADWERYGREIEADLIDILTRTWKVQQSRKRSWRERLARWVAGSR